MMTRRLCLALALCGGFALSAAAQTAPSGSPAVPAPTTVRPTAPQTGAKPDSTKPAVALVDINTASKEQLEKLKGVGAARSDAIIKGRPYRAKDELVDKKILPKNIYDDVKDQIVARQKN